MGQRHFKGSRKSVEGVVVFYGRGFYLGVDFFRLIKGLISRDDVTFMMFV